jgi:hypothetical protein
MLKMTKTYTNKKSGEVLTEREFFKLSKSERVDYKPTPKTNHPNYRC